MPTASLIRVANLDQLHGDGPHALSADGFDVVVVRTPAGLRAFEGRFSLSLLASTDATSIKLTSFLSTE